MEVSRQNILYDDITDFPVNNRFIKLPIKKYLKLINIEPIPPQIALINAVQNPEYRFITAVLSRRTGKSFISNIIGQLILLIPDTQILIIAPNYSLAKVSWDIQLRLIKMFNLELERKNEKDREIELKNGSVIRMGSVSRADSVVGRSYDLVIFDEAALNSDGGDVFNIQLMPTLDKETSKAIFISTPRGKNWFHDFYKRGFSAAYPSWASIRSSWRDNPRAITEVIEDAKNGMSKDEFAQEHECSFISLEGQIWELNTDCILPVDVNSIDVYDVIAGIDIGYRDSTAMVIILTDGYNYIIVDEYEENKKSTSEYATVIQEKVDKWNIDFIYIDSAAQQTKFDLAYSYNISSINADKSILDGIGYVASIVAQNRLIIDYKCLTVIDSINNYVWDSREGLINEKPLHNKYCHMGDAIRYAVYSHRHNVDPISDIDLSKCLIVPEETSKILLQDKIIEETQNITYG